MPNDVTPTIYATASAASQSSVSESAPLFFLPLFGFVILVFIALGLLAFALWIWGIVHAAKNPYITDSTVRAVWLILMVLIGFPVTVVYFFTRPKGVANSAQQVQTPQVK